MKKKWSLNLIFTLPFLLQMFVTVGLIGFFSYQTGKQSALEFANQLREKIDAEIKQKLDQYLSIPHLVNRLNIAAIDRGDLSLDLTHYNPKNELYLWQMIQQFPEIGWISLGTESGGEDLSIVREPPNPIKIVLSNVYTDYYTTVYILDAQGKRIAANPTRKPYQYDARKRPWYYNAAMVGHPAWSPIYQAPPQATKDNIFISNSYPIFNKNHQLLGITCVDYDLVNIQKFIQKLSLGNHHTGRTFIIERSGLLVASSTGERPFLKKNGK